MATREIKAPVYEEWNHALLPARGHGRDVHYRVFYGTVNWEGRPETLRRAVTVLMQYGSSESWKDACSRGEIAFGEPPHVLVEDLPEVVLAFADVTNVMRPAGGDR